MIDVMAGGEKIIVTDDLEIEAILNLRGAPMTNGLSVVGMVTILLNVL